MGGEATAKEPTRPAGTTSSSLRRWPYSRGPTGSASSAAARATSPAFVWNSVSGARALNQDNYSDGPSNPFGTASIDSEQMSVYATYTAG
jgi:hypothetical protein